jgi:hypothetical protein
VKIENFEFEKLIINLNQDECLDIVRVKQIIIICPDTKPVLTRYCLTVTRPTMYYDDPVSKTKMFLSLEEYKKEEGIISSTLEKLKDYKTLT